MEQPDLFVCVEECKQWLCGFELLLSHRGRQQAAVLVCTTTGGKVVPTAAPQRACVRS